MGTIEMPPSNTAAPDPSEITLACLGGGHPDASLVRDWGAYQELPITAFAALHELLQQAYEMPLGPELAELVGSFSHKVGVYPLDVQNALQACRFLFSNAVGVGLESDPFRDDLVRLNPASDAGIDQLVFHYQNYGLPRRQQAIQNSLFEHGKVLTRLDWRIDTSLASSRAAVIDLPLVVLSVGYREGSGDRARSDSVSFTLPASEIGNIRAVLDRIEATLALRFESSDEAVVS